MPAVAPLQRMHSLEEEQMANCVRILVAGDAAVGKTRLCDLICHGSCSRERAGDVSALITGQGAPPEKEWTCGCSLSITRETVDIDFKNIEVEVELWEVGGTKTYSCARPVFYDSLNAVVLVYDVSNMKSYHSLVAWLFELCTSVKPPSLKYWDTGGGSGGVPDMDLELGDSGALQQGILSGRCPVLFVANKCDLQELLRGDVNRPRPQPPERPPLVDRLLGGGGLPADSFLQGRNRSSADAQLMERLCDFVQQGRHTEACCRDGQLHFDFNLWNDFVKQVYKAKPFIDS
eukprot:TRINITY_DN36759_c0_g1_i1.p1 TRINITY_DN36759_c0_g1~~TRINITY_DN36759_c0_g1_i1.p1  ORF type:complete len:290 (-),score=73.77 TRINITY_DN36759_c0_g1_i1:39-908(-)